MNTTAKKITATAFMALFLAASGPGVASAASADRCAKNTENFSMYQGKCVSDGQREKMNSDD